MNMFKPLAWLALAIGLSGCVVEERTVAARPAPRCGGAVWVEGHYGRHGRFHPGRWRCPGEVVVVEAD